MLTVSKQQQAKWIASCYFLVFFKKKNSVFFQVLQNKNEILKNSLVLSVEQNVDMLKTFLSMLKGISFYKLEN